jgi:hypothetical protein
VLCLTLSFDRLLYISFSNLSEIRLGNSAIQHIIGGCVFRLGWRRLDRATNAVVTLDCLRCVLGPSEGRCAPKAMNRSPGTRFVAPWQRFARP